jgi:hypothetical protein
MVLSASGKRRRSRSRYARLIGLVITLTFVFSSVASAGAMSLVAEADTGANLRPEKETQSSSDTVIQDHFSTLYREYIWWTVAQESMDQEQQTDDWRFIEDNVFLPGAVAQSSAEFDGSNSLHDYLAPKPKTSSAGAIYSGQGEGWFRGNASEHSSGSGPAVDRADSINGLQSESAAKTVRNADDMKFLEEYMNLGSVALPQSSGRGNDFR